MDATDGKLPVKEEFADRGAAAAPSATVPKSRLRCGAAGALADLAEEYVFFSPALLYAYGRFDDAHLAQVMWELGEDVPVFWYKGRRPVLGMPPAPDGSSDWAHAVFAVRPRHWGPVRDHVLGLTVVDRDEGLVLRYGEQRFAVLDPLAADLSVVVRPDSPLLGLSVFGLRGNKGTLAFEPPADPRVGTPRLIRLRPSRDDLAFADALLAWHNPFHAVDRLRGKGNAR